MIPLSIRLRNAVDLMPEFYQDIMHGDFRNIQDPCEFICYLMHNRVCPCLVTEYYMDVVCQQYDEMENNIQGIVTDLLEEDFYDATTGHIVSVFEKYKEFTGQKLTEMGNLYFPLGTKYRHLTDNDINRLIQRNK